MWGNKISQTPKINPGVLTVIIGRVCHLALNTLPGG